MPHGRTLLSSPAIRSQDTIPAYAQTTRKRRWSASVGTTRETASSKSSEASERFEAALERTRASVRATVEQLVRPLADRGIPWAVTFGNHDFQCGLGNAEIESICREFPGCLNPDSARLQAEQYLPSQRVFACEPGTFALPGFRRGSYDVRAWSGIAGFRRLRTFRRVWKSVRGGVAISCRSAGNDGYAISETGSFARNREIAGTGSAVHGISAFSGGNSITNC